MRIMYRDLLATAQYCVDIKLVSINMPDKQEDTPLFDQVQYLFQEIFALGRFEPSHILVSERDLNTLHRVARQIGWAHDLLYQFGIDNLQVSSSRYITSIRNLTTGKVVQMASLPDLEEGSVKVGFFPVHFEVSTARDMIR